MIPPWVRFDCVCVGSVPHFFIHFGVIGVSDRRVRGAFASPMSVPIPSLAMAVIEAIDEDWNELSKQHDAKVLMAKACVSLTLAELMKANPSIHFPGLSDWETMPASIQRVLRYIESHLGEACDNATLASLTGMSRDHFIRTFRSQVGLTPKQYIMERRVIMASHLLAESKQSIDEIAMECGFNDRFYLSRVFKEKMGRPPGIYRREIRV